MELGSSLRCGLRHVPCVHYGVWGEVPQLPWDAKSDRSTPNWTGTLKVSAWVTAAKLKESKSHAWSDSQGVEEVTAAYIVKKHPELYDKSKLLKKELKIGTTTHTSCL